MKFQQQFKMEDIKKAIIDKLERIELVILIRLRLIGEQFVKNARENANFKDRTGNLRASIGYIILKNGKRVESDFRSGTGGTTAQAIAAKVGAQFPKGFALIVVAGMDYAAAVESKNYDVLTASSLVAESMLKTAMETLTEKIGKMP